MYQMTSPASATLCRNLSFAGGKVPAKTQGWLDGRYVDSSASKWIDVPNPATNEVVTRVPQNTQAEMEQAVESAKGAFNGWSQTSPLKRQEIMFKYQNLIKANLSEIAKLITLEQGKTIPDAEGDVMRGLQVVEQCCSLTNLLLGETLPGITKVLL